ncbi:zf-HC2 domain-containing protein [Micromonospora avicenniae]|uniref:zf-HC2 domain-containing protein n=1 Tax=Micromonospora avicenniae TaxID=1198245 RepID=UPI003322717E
MTDDGDGTRCTCDGCGPYLLGALRPDAVVAFEAHLLECGRCQRECERLGPTVSAVAGLGPDEAVEFPDAAEEEARVVPVSRSSPPPHLG